MYTQITPFFLRPTMINHSIARLTPSLLRFLFLLLILAENGGFFKLADGGKGRVHITDDLDDVVDDEEDDSWKEWGKKSSESNAKFDPPPMDFSGMDLSKIQSEMMKRQFGPVFGFVKLRPGVRRSPDMVSEIAMKWTKVSRTGNIEVKFMGVDRSTIMFNMDKGQDSLELKDFILSQTEAYEVKIGDQLFQRPGDPPFEEVLKNLKQDTDSGDHTSFNEEKEEL